jgi:organic radical activating enzyme
MPSTAINPSITPREILTSWGRILAGRVPLLSIEITRECPLSCPGCYAYGDTHLSGGVTLRELNDKRGDALVDGVLDLVRKHKPMHVSLVGGEPLVRHRELSKILPALSQMSVFTLVVTSAVIPIPTEWMKIPRVRVAVSIDGLPEDHDIRRKPATYERILKNIEGREVNIHWTITRPMLSRPGYLEEYIAFWKETPEMLTRENRETLARVLPALTVKYPKLLMNEGIAKTFLAPPANPDECLFAKMSANYSADFKSRVEPCIFGGNPDCSQCGCAISSGLHWIRDVKVVGPLKVKHFVGSSIGVGLAMNKLRSDGLRPGRWKAGKRQTTPKPDLIQLQP